MTNLFSAGRPSSSALAASSRESMRRRLCRISATNSISLRRIACVSIGSHGAKTVSGWNGQRLTGNSSSTMCARDSSNLKADSFWNSIGARTVLHFSRQNCARFLNRKVRESCGGKRCLLRIRLSGHDSKQGAAVSSPPNQREGGLETSPPSTLIVSGFAQSFQSEQSQLSSCSVLEMSSANRL